MTAILLPSLLHSNSLMPPLDSVIFSASPPATGSIYTLFFPSREEVNAIDLLSGLHFGFELFLSPVVNCLALDPSNALIHI